MAYFQTSIATQQTSSGSKSYTPVKRDMVMSVTGYDTAQNIIFGTLNDGRTAAVSIDAEAFGRGVKTEQRDPARTKAAPYLTHRIDRKMEEKIPVGHYVILENAEVLRKDKKSGNRIMKATRVIAAGKNKNKIIEALFTFTMNHKLNKVERVQAWVGEAFMADDAEQAKELKERMDQSFEQHQTEEAKLEEAKSSFWLPYIGFELRALLPAFNPVEAAKIVDVSGRFECSVVQTEDSTTRTQLKGEDFDKIVKQYSEYVKEHYGHDARVEASWYISYPNGQYCSDLDFNSVNGYNPYLRMATAKSKLSSNDEQTVEGGNFGGWGVICLSKDVIDDNSKVVPRFYVSKVYVNTKAKNFVQQKIKSPDGMMPTLSNEMKGDLMQYGQVYVPENNTLETALPEFNAMITADNMQAAPQTVAAFRDPWSEDETDDVPFDPPASGYTVPEATKPVPSTGIRPRFTA